jgi:outer membrane immunogenic protein
VCFAFGATAAVAADLPRAPAGFVPVAYNWTGLYLGINGGYAWGSSRWSGYANNADPSGVMVGGTIGYNWQALGSPWVFGLEGDIDWTNIKGTFTSVTCPTGCQTKKYLAARGRLGYAWDRVMPYVTGGAAFKASQVGFTGVNSTKAGQPGPASRPRWLVTGLQRSNISTWTLATRIAAQ